MIEIALHGANFIMLKGDCLNPRLSSIALHKGGWVLTTVWSDAAWMPNVFEGLHRNRVIPTLAKLIVDKGFSTETIKTGEINEHMDTIQTTQTDRLEIVGESDQAALRLALAFVESRMPNSVTTDIGRYSELLKEPIRVADILRVALGETL